MTTARQDKIEDARDDRAERFFLLANQWFRYHVFGYVLGNGLLYLINKATSEAWWAFWPLFAWSLLLACHYFLIRSVRADNAWAQDRALRLRAKSYDIDHIRAIEHSFQTRTMPGRHDLNWAAEVGREGED